MKLRVALYVSGLISLMLALAMTLPLIVSLFFKDGDTKTFAVSIIVTLAIGGFLFIFFKSNDTEVGHRDGFLIVALAWITACVFSSLPYLISGALPTIADAFFEGTSGITTTGASILTDIESLSHAMLFWRSFTQWLGGMGIVIVGVAILPLLGVGGMQLYKAEASTISGDKFVPRISEMARILLVIYLVLSLSMAVLLLLSGMGLYDTLIHTLSGASTGGFSNYNGSIGSFGNVWIEAIIIVFMVLGATNFALHYGVYREGFKVFFRNEEFKFYILIMVVSTAAVTINLAVSHYGSIGAAFRHAVFQVVSIATTTGYSTVDYGLWPSFSQIVILSLIFVGGSAGSTTGAIKCVRLLLMLKLLKKEVSTLIHPHAIIPVKMNGRVIDSDILRSVTTFAFLFFIVFVVSSFVLSALGLDTFTAISSAAATLGNVGPALGVTGPASNYSMVPEAAKWVLTVNMLLGRLEIYTLLILFVPAFWRA